MRLTYPVLTGELAGWDNFQAALANIQSFLINPNDLRVLTHQAMRTSGARANNYPGLILNPETGVKFNGSNDAIKKTKFSKNSIYQSLMSGKALGMVNKFTHEFIKTHGKWTTSKKIQLAEAGFVPAHFVRG